MNRLFRTLSIVAFACLLAVPVDGFAHENRQVADNTYNLEVGFINEPAFVNQQNGVFLVVQRIEHEETGATPTAGEEEDHHDGAIDGVTGLDATLQVEIIYVDQSMPLTLVPTSDAGVYEAIFFPTAVGDYSFRIFGTIEGTPIDETFTSSPQGFASVEDIAPLQFPKAG